MLKNLFVFFGFFIFLQWSNASKCPETSDTGILNQDPSIFDTLTIEEMERAMEILMTTDGVAENLQNPAPELGPNCFSYIYLMDPYYPPKEDVLAYLDCTGNKCPEKPARYARTTINRGCEGDVIEYKVGPLDSDHGEPTVEQLQKTRPFEVRPRDGVEYRAVKPIIKKTLDTLKPLLMESFAGMYFEDEEGNNMGLDYHITAPPGTLSSERLNRVLTVMKIPGTGRVKDLHALPLQYRMWSLGSDPSKWYTYDFYYNRQGPYSTAEELLNAYNSGSLKKVTLSEDHREKVLDWIKPTLREGQKMRPMADRAPPELYEPQGHRFEVEGHVVHWMGWQFHISSLQQRGPAIRDVRFMGQRIAYEVASNEVSLVYSANDPVQGNVVYFDATFGVGETKDMMKGIDCPSTAVYLDDTWFSSGSGPNYVKNAFCVFEQNTGMPAWRRLDGYESGLVETELVVRAALPVGNYDYMFDFRFKLNGQLYVVMSASGNIQSYFHTGDTNEEPAHSQFGTRVYEHTVGALHDHQFSFRVDLDVLGTKNWVDKNTYIVGSTEKAYKQDPLNQKSVPPYEEYSYKRYVKHETLTTEKKTALQLDYEKPWNLYISNHDQLNSWGNKRSYELAFEASTVNDIPDGHPVMVGGTFRKYNAVVTVYNETEKTSTTPFVLNALKDPAYTFDKYLENDESVEGKDLVLWVSFGFMHMPRAEDVPVQVTASRGFHLIPFNYFDENPTFDCSAQVRDNRGDDLGDGDYIQFEPNYKTCQPKKAVYAKNANSAGQEPVNVPCSCF